MNFQYISTFCTTAEIKVNNSMLYRIPKTFLLLAFFGALAAFNYASAKGETNKLDDATSTMNKFVWLAEETNYLGQANTNGLSFNLEMENWKLNGIPRTTHCWIYICNLAWPDQALHPSKRIDYWYDHSPFPRRDMTIELIDSKGQPVEKTSLGKEYGKTIDLKQVQEAAKKRSQKWRTGWARTDGFTTATANAPLTSFNPAELFEPKEAGEYTMRVQMPLIQRVGNDEANPEIKVIWLPEVTAKIEIRTEEISPPELPPNAQTK